MSKDNPRPFRVGVSYDPIFGISIIDILLAVFFGIKSEKINIKPINRSTGGWEFAALRRAVYPP